VLCVRCGSQPGLGHRFYNRLSLGLGLKLGLGLWLGFGLELRKGLGYLQLVKRLDRRGVTQC
jgi:hypothetical protein